MLIIATLLILLIVATLLIKAIFTIHIRAISIIKIIITLQVALQILIISCSQLVPQQAATREVINMINTIDMINTINKINMINKINTINRINTTNTTVAAIQAQAGILKAQVAPARITLNSAVRRLIIQAVTQVVEKAARPQNTRAPNPEELQTTIPAAARVRTIITNSWAKSILILPLLVLHMAKTTRNPTIKETAEAALNMKAEIILQNLKIRITITVARTEANPIVIAEIIGIIETREIVEIINTVVVIIIEVMIEEILVEALISKHL